MTDDIDILAATAYETGIDPIHYAAEHVIQAHIDARDDRKSGTGLPASAVARMILGDLLNARLDAAGGDPVTDHDTAQAIEALASRIRTRDTEADRADADVFALEFLTALRGRGWRPTAAKVTAPPLHAPPVPDRRSRDEELAAVRAEMAARAAAREADEGAA